MDGAAGNVELVERFPAAFDRRRPTEEELETLLARGVRFVERPSLVSPKGSEGDAAAMRAERQIVEIGQHDSYDPPATGG